MVARKFIIMTHTRSTVGLLIILTVIIVVLWPMFHYILWDTATDGREETNNWTQYVKVNERFTDKIVELYKPGDIGNYLLSNFQCVDYDE
jgi:hypothetical protein